MTNETPPAQMRDLIVERLTGATGDPERVMDAARACGDRAIPALAASLAQMLPAPVEIEVAEVLLGRFGDAIPAPGSHGAMVIVPAETSPDALLIAAEPEAIALVVCALFGGDAEEAVAPIRRPLSSIEQQVTKNLFEEIAGAFNGGGTRTMGLKRPLPKPLFGAELARAVVRDGPAVNIRFRLSFGISSGHISVMMPQRVLMSLRGEASATVRPVAPAQWRARFSEEIMRSTVTLRATIPLSAMTLGEIAQLKPGHIIEMPENAQSQTRLSARDRMLFNCEFGKLGQNYTVRVIQPFNAEQDLVDSLMAK